MSTGNYAVLMETSGEDHESWYYFIKFSGNEKALTNIKNQLDSINDSTILEEINLFDIDIENLVSEETAKQMCMLELNSVTYHRKFNGTLKDIDFGFKDKHTDTQKLFKVFDLLGNGDIDEYISDEDIPISHEMSDDDLSVTEKDDGDMDESKMPTSLRNLKL